MKFNPHWYVTVPSYWAETNVLCLDQGIQVMGNNSVSVVVSTKFLCSFKLKKKKKTRLKICHVELSEWNIFQVSTSEFCVRNVLLSSCNEWILLWCLSTRRNYNNLILLLCIDSMSGEQHLIAFLPFVSSYVWLYKETSTENNAFKVI